MPQHGEGLMGGVRSGVNMVEQQYGGVNMVGQQYGRGDRHSIPDGLLV